MKGKFTLLTIIIAFTFLVSCNDEYLPKPRGYYRIDFPDKEYRTIDLALPYSFEIPVYSLCELDKSYNSEPFWINIHIPANKATFHISYKKINNDLDLLSEDSHKLTYEHTVKASAINEQYYYDPAKKVFGTIYQIKGNAASPIMFHLTDSVSHFVRGSVYISETPNYDSLRPVIQFLEEDIHYLISTFTWNNHAILSSNK